jgi:queuine tRNA-ribosyltransferase
MSSSTTEKDETTTTTTSSQQESNDNSKRKADCFQKEPIKPEWLQLPPELASIDFENSIAWNKYAPYVKDRPMPLVPLDAPPVFTNDTPALCFHVHAICGRARACTLYFPNGGPPVPTPRFMPVGTKGTLKGVLPEELERMDCPIILANTYHLAIQPGTDLIANGGFGGLHTFMGGTIAKTNNKTKKRRLFNLLTDSGGFQMVSLAELSIVTEDSVVFESPYTKGEIMRLRPEDSIRCQNEIGADIIMQLDDVISSAATDDERFRIATFRTLRWYDRCVKAHAKMTTQNLFPILQGHLDISKGGLRDLCLAGFRHRDQISEKKIPGFAIGGLAGGESKDDFWKVIDHACQALPDDRPRYLMGVGYPLDLVVCTALGVDQYDCVYPTRTARFGVALVDAGQVKLQRHEYANRTSNQQPIDETCPCQACSQGVSRARLHQLLKSSNTMAVQLLTQHNVTYMMGLVNRMRQAIMDQRFPSFVRMFVQQQFPKAADDVPQWVVDALEAAGIALPNEYEHETKKVE